MITIRKAGISDAYGLYVCNRALLPIYYSVDEYLYFTLLSPYKEVLIAEKDKKICGYILGEYDGRFMHVLSFAVYPEYRRQGVGKKLMNELVKIAMANKGTDTLSLNVHVENSGGIAFYEAYGFKKIETLNNYYRGSLKAKSQDAYRLEYPFKKENES
jgi:ribosomal-protein-alanine N-acetyltransferase